jgi:hypothetical protein
MKVFLSWSGDRSKVVAESLHRWLPRIVNAVEPWISTHMEKGVRGGVEMAGALEGTAFGIICLTQDNLDAPWILFEAGALSKTSEGRLWTFLFDIAPADVKRPLGEFQHTVNTKADIGKLIRTINQRVKELGEKGLDDSALTEQFEDLYPKFEAMLATVPARKNAASAAPKRAERDILEEILEILRNERRPRLPSSALQRRSILLHLAVDPGVVEKFMKTHAHSPWTTLWRSWSVSPDSPHGGTILSLEDASLTAADVKAIFADLGVNSFRHVPREGIIVREHGHPVVSD